MANVDAPRGLVPVKMLGNKYETAGFSTYKVASGYNQNLFNPFNCVSKLTQPIPS